MDPWNLLAVVRKELTNLCLSLRAGSGRLPGMGALCLSENFFGGLILSKGLFCHWDFSMLWKCRLVGTSARNTKHHQSRPLGSGSPGSETHLTPFSYVPSGRMTSRSKHCQGEDLFIGTSLKVTLLTHREAIAAFYFSSSKQNQNLWWSFLCSCVPLNLLNSIGLKEHPVLILLETETFQGISFNIKLIRIYIPSTTIYCLLLYQALDWALHLSLVRTRSFLPPSSRHPPPSLSGDYLGF